MGEFVEEMLPDLHDLARQGGKLIMGMVPEDPTAKAAAYHTLHNLR